MEEFYDDGARSLQDRFDPWAADALPTGDPAHDKTREVAKR
jgi:hypothetical protein